MKRNEVKVKLNIIETDEVPRDIEVTMTPQQYKNYENGECVDCLHFAMSLAIVEEKGLYRCTIS